MSTQNTTVRIPSMTSKKVWQEAGQRCSLCVESAVEALHIHHIKAWEHGGSNRIENLILVCANCHGKIIYGHIFKLPTVQGRPYLNHTIEPFIVAWEAMKIGMTLIPRLASPC